MLSKFSKLLVLIIAMFFFLILIPLFLIYLHIQGSGKLNYAYGYQNDTQISSNPTIEERFLKRSQWQSHLNELKDRKQNLRFLKAHLENLSDGYYYAFQTADYLVKDGSEEAMLILKSRLEESQKRGTDSGLIAKWKVSVMQIEILRDIKGLGPSDQAFTVGKIFEDELVNQSEYLPQSTRKYYFKWLVETLSGIDDRASLDILKKIWQNEAYDGEIRYKAQEILVQKGAMDPSQRTITFLRERR